LQTSGLSAATGVDQEVASSNAIRCTAGCTGERAAGIQSVGDPLAEFVSALTPEQRRRLVDLLTESKEGGGL
jgi:hypothetical protein